METFNNIITIWNKRNQLLEDHKKKSNSTSDITDTRKFVEQIQDIYRQIDIILDNVKPIEIVFYRLCRYDCIGSFCLGDRLIISHDDLKQIGLLNVDAYLKDNYGWDNLSKERLALRDECGHSNSHYCSGIHVSPYTGGATPVMIDKHGNKHKFEDNNKPNYIIIGDINCFHKDHVRDNSILIKQWFAKHQMFSVHVTPDIKIDEYKTWAVYNVKIFH
jgi:hypothetical protein